MADKEDEFLTELFRSEPVADNGFSRKLTRRIRLQLWIERLALPVAAGLGAVFAVKPLAQLMEMLLRLLPTERLVSPEISSTGLQALVSNQQGVMLGLVLLLAIGFYQFIED